MAPVFGQEVQERSCRNLPQEKSELLPFGVSMGKTGLADPLRETPCGPTVDLQTLGILAKRCASR